MKAAQTEKFSLVRSLVQAGKFFKPEHTYTYAYESYQVSTKIFLFLDLPRGSLGLKVFLVMFLHPRAGCPSPPNLNCWSYLKLEKINQLKNEYNSTRDF